MALTNILFSGPFWGLFKGLWLEGLIWLILINFAIYLCTRIIFIIHSGFFFLLGVFWKRYLHSKVNKF